MYEDKLLHLMQEITNQFTSIGGQEAQRREYVPAIAGQGYPRANFSGVHLGYGWPGSAQLARWTFGFDMGTRSSHTKGGDPVRRRNWYGNSKTARNLFW